METTIGFRATTLGTILGCVGAILGLYKDNEKQNRNYRNYRGYIGIILLPSVTHYNKKLTSLLKISVNARS